MRVLLTFGDEVDHSVRLVQAGVVVVPDPRRGAHRQGLGGHMLGPQRAVQLHHVQRQPVAATAASRLRETAHPVQRRVAAVAPEEGIRGISNTN